MKTKSKKKPQAYTSEEVRAKLFNHMKGLVNYWSEEPTLQFHKQHFPDVQSRMLGLCHSILVMLDGEAADIPQIELVIRPQPEDKEYHTSHGEKYFKDGMVLT
jgi:hypothetical protein